MTAPRLRSCPHCGGSLRPARQPWPRPGTAAARILDALTAYAPLPLTLADLVDASGALPSTVSQHLTRLVRDGLVQRWRVGNTAQYRAAHNIDIDTSHWREE